MNDDAIHQALSNLDTTGGEVIRRALGDNYEAVSEDLPHRDELCSALAFYSIADPTHPGVTLDEILLATLDPGENPIRIRDSLAQLKQRAFNFYERDERFVAVENPHARINAMAASQIVTRDAARGHVLSVPETCWNGKERTTVFTAPDWSSLQEGLRSLHNARLRIVLCTTVLSPEERLRVQNADEKRNLVLMVEPSVRTSTGESRYNLLTNDALRRRARSCWRGGRLRRLPMSTGRCSTTRRTVSTRPRSTRCSSGRWQEFRTRSVRELEAWFETTPGLPVPIEAGWITAAAKQLACEKVLSLVQDDGSRVTPASLKTMTDDSLRACTLAAPSVETTAPPPPASPQLGDRADLPGGHGQNSGFYGWVPRCRACSRRAFTPT